MLFANARGTANSIDAGRSDSIDWLAGRQAREKVADASGIGADVADTVSRLRAHLDHALAVVVAHLDHDVVVEVEQARTRNRLHRMRDRVVVSHVPAHIFRG